MRSLLVCVILLPLFVSCSETSQTNRTAIASTVQNPESQAAMNSKLVNLEKEGGFRQSRNEITNSIGIKFLLIPKGTFTMGPPIDSKEVGPDEVERKEYAVTISNDFYLGVFEVTQKQYEKVMGKNPSYFRAPYFGKTDSSNCPVEQVSWNDAVEFCRRLSDLPEEKKLSRVYRLPTEAQWEYACRAGSNTAYCFGDNPKLLRQYAWYGANCEDTTQPVGEKKPNEWGLHDMHGNVFEWCSDKFTDRLQGKVTDPDIQNRGVERVIRGGSWFNSSAQCSSTERHPNSPEWGDYQTGFRVTLSSPSEIPK